MKYALIALFVVFNPVVTIAQKDNVFADVGIPGGFSATYNYKIPKRPGLGMGLQGYAIAPTGFSANQFVPAVFADIRFYHPKRKHLFFYLVDLGVDFYTFGDIHTIYKTVTSTNHGIYLGLGLGYFRPVTKRGAGPYASLKFISNGCTIDEYFFATGQDSKSFNLNGTFAFSIGFKF